MKLRKKLIEVAMPLDAINQASAREKSIRHGHPSTLHLWWARRPLAAARAVIFGQMVDDPSSVPEEFPTIESQDAERQRLFRIIEDMVPWESTTKEEILERARLEIWKSWRRACADNSDHPQAAELFNPEKLPGFHDPFAGGGSLPLEAQRLGLEAYATDLNPVAVLINKAMIEIPPKFAGLPPVNPESRADKRLVDKVWKGAEGLAEDVRYYGKWMRDEAFKRIGHLYPKVNITAEMAAERADLKPLIGQSLTVIAWIWARTVKSPNPAFSHVDVPLASTFVLSATAGKEAYIEPIVEGDRYQFAMRVGKPIEKQVATGSKSGRANFRCVVSGEPISAHYIRTEGQAGRLGARLMAVVAEAGRGRTFLKPLRSHEDVASLAEARWRPVGKMPGNPRWFSPPLYGLASYCDLFTPRQLLALTTFSDLVQAVQDKIMSDIGDKRTGREGGTYARAVGVYLGFALSRMADRHSSLCRWDPNPTGYAPKIANTFGRQALPMVWDFAEGNPFSPSSGNFLDALEWIVKVMLYSFPARCQGGRSSQWDAAQPATSKLSKSIISTDPPYYDNIGYADLSDFFYVWLRRTLSRALPPLFATVEVPKADELIASPYRHGSKQSAEEFFLGGMTRAMSCLVQESLPGYPVTIYYAFKQTESDKGTEIASTGWETFLQAVITAGFGISGTWPIRTELGNRMISKGTNALASSIVLVCRARDPQARAATQREFLSQLKRELPVALQHLREGNIALVDLQQASIGPGMDVFTRYSKVIGANGQPMTVREALVAINQTLDELVAEREGELDRDTQWAVAWFDHAGFADGDFGVAENLCKAKNTSVTGMEKSGLIAARAGKVRLLKPEELSSKWDPNNPKVSEWEILHQLIRVHSTQAESAVADLVRKLGGRADFVPDLCLGLHRTCELKKRASEAAWYNALGQSWHEICRLAQSEPAVTPATPVQQSLEL